MLAQGGGAMRRGIVRIGRLGALCLAVLMVISLGGLAPSAMAADIRNGQTVVIPAGEIVTDDVYASGMRVEVAGTIRGDLVAAAQSVVITGEVTGDLLVMAQDVRVLGRVGGSVRAMAMRVEVTGAVQEDLVALANTVVVPAGATVGRDLLLAAQTATIDGAVGRNVRGSAGNLTINDGVRGNVEGDFGHLTIGPQAAIGGDVKYRSPYEATIAQGAKIGGRVEYTPVHKPGTFPWLLAIFVAWLRGLVGLFLFSLLIAWILPRYSTRAVETISRRPWTSLGIGVLALIVVPIVAAIIFGVGLFVGGWWIATVLLAGLWLLGALSYAVVTLGFGRVLSQWLGFAGAWMPWKVLAAAAVLLVLLLIPFLGALVGFLIVAVGIGGQLLALRAPTGPAPAVGEGSETPAS
jgi:cytoskeletal protein CcmA (bactofilin family)